MITNSTNIQDELLDALTNYLTKWQKVVGDIDSLKDIRPTALGWKVQDLAQFTRICDSLRDQSEQVHYGWVNERWLATFYLKQPLTPGNVQVVKIMQRRPGSQDAIGLDHVDFLVPDFEQTIALLKKEPSLTWSQEANGDHCKWLSVWFENTEAKLRTDTVLQVCADEMLEFQQKLLEG